MAIACWTRPAVARSARPQPWGTWIGPDELDVSSSHLRSVFYLLPGLIETSRDHRWSLAERTSASPCSNSIFAQGYVLRKLDIVTLLVAYEELPSFS